MNSLKKFGALLGSLLSALYLSNIGMGVIEIIPDNIPVAGNIDELVASLILLRCLLALGVDPMSLKELALRHVAKKKAQAKTIEVDVEQS